MIKYPIFLDLTNAQALVVGAGSVAARKVKTLIEAGATVKVISRQVEKTFEESCQGLHVNVTKAEYSKSYLADAFLVIAATNDQELNARVYNDCKDLKILCNVVDVPGLCNFHVPSVIRQGDLQIAISTNGKCPAYAAHLRRKFQETITDDHGRFLDMLDETRQYIIRHVREPQRKELLSKLADDTSFQLFLDKGADAWKLTAQELIAGYDT